MVARIQSLNDLKLHLQAALELEHSTIPPYLCALYSIKVGQNPEACEIIRTVVVQEMLHMVLVANLLNALGGAPSVAHPEFVPTYPARLPIGDDEPLVVPLRKFAPDTLDTFLAIEHPAKSNAAHSLLSTDRSLPTEPGQLSAMIRRGELYGSIGDFYDAIETGLIALEKQAVAKPGRGTLFHSRRRQLGPQHYYGAGGAAIEVHDLETALTALRLIIRQGEGYGDGTGDGDGVGDSREIAHYYRFDEIRQGRRYRPNDRPGTPTGVVFTVGYDADSVYDMVDNPTITTFAPGEVRDRAMGFATAYTGLLRQLDHAFNGHPECALDAVVDMFALRRMALDLIANPAPELNGNAGPCFAYLPTMRSHDGGAKASLGLEGQPFIASTQQD